nr:hypothetical protein [Rubripirellula reticaptiva]
MVLAVTVAALASRLLRIGFELLAERNPLTLCFTPDYFYPSGQFLDLFDEHVVDRLLLFKQQLAIEGIGSDLGNIHTRKSWSIHRKFTNTSFSLGNRVPLSKCFKKKAFSLLCKIG